jgi:hypothetical protein
MDTDVASDQKGSEVAIGPPRMDFIA